MIRINFLPEHKAPVRRAKRSATPLAAGAMVLLTIGGAVFYGTELATLHALQVERAQTQQQVTQVQGQLKRAQELHQQEDQLTSQLASYQALRGRPWSQVLLGLADRTPQGLSWSQLAADDAAIGIQGHARSLTDVSQFMGGIAGDPNASGSRIHSVTEDLYRYGYDLTIDLAAQPAPEGGKANGRQ